MKDDRVFLIDMLETARRIQLRMINLTREEFDKNEDLRLSLAYLIQIVGEAARRVSQTKRQSLPQIPWLHVTGMRHHIVHEYTNVDFDIVWETASQDIPALIQILGPIVEPIIDQAKSKNGK
jgi:uncharacterized protein with HEPN domain